MKHMDWKTLGKKIGCAVAVSIMVIVLLSGTMGVLITNELLGLGTGKKILAGAVLILMFVASWVTAKKAPGKRLVIATLTAALLLVVLLIAKSILFQGMEWTSPWRICAMMLVSLPAGLLASGKKSRRR